MSGNAQLAANPIAHVTATPASPAKFSGVAALGGAWSRVWPAGASAAPPPLSCVAGPQRTEAPVTPPSGVRATAKPEARGAPGVLDAVGGAASADLSEQSSNERSSSERGLDLVTRALVASALAESPIGSPLPLGADDLRSLLAMLPALRAGIDATLAAAHAPYFDRGGHGTRAARPATDMGGSR